MHETQQPVSFLTISIVISSALYYIWLHFQFVRAHEKDLAAEQRIQIMMSQIQPHFLYNTLATIRSLCLKSPETAAQTIDKFSRYLRQNLDTLSQSGLIPFRQELEHVKIYTEIEMLMFPYIHIRYDIEDDRFMESKENTETFQERLAYVLEAISQTEDGRKAIETYRKQLQQSLAAIYYAGPTGNRSAALSAYGYSELCMELDYTYGLKDEHGIQSFAAYLNQTGLTQKLFDPDAAAADSAIGELTEYWLDDGHSGFDGSSYLVGYTGSTWDTGFSMSQSGDLYETVVQIRSNYPDAVLPYYEVGDTAYITFDVFEIDPSIKSMSDYYALDEQGALPHDTIGLLITAHREITRENSPIENVVMDLSMNGGGESPAAVFALCWFLGDAQVSVVDPLSGAESTVSYRADLNLDHRFDEYDSLSGLNLFCLISPSAFSCGNLLPWAFKEDGRVTLLGKTSGGGSCVVRQLSTAWGTAYQISGDIRISFVKNGAYYNVDRGADPDCFIRSYHDFFDRDALTAYIHELR